MPNTTTLRGERARLLHALLDRHAAELMARKQDLRRLADDAAEITQDAGAALARESRGLGAAMASLTARTVQHIETSLRRLQSGTYGICSDCEGPIATARLRALPFADACRDCQERRDEAGGAFPLLV